MISAPFGVRRRLMSRSCAEFGPCTSVASLACLRGPGQSTLSPDYQQLWLQAALVVLIRQYIFLL